MQRVRHGRVGVHSRPLAADGLGGRRRPPLVAGQPHVTLRIKKIAERRTIWRAAAPRGPNSPRRAAAAKRIFQGAQEGKSQRPGGFLGPSCGCSASTGPDFCAAPNAAIRTARGSKLTDLVLRSPQVHVRIDCGRGGRRAPPRAAPGQHRKNTAPLWLPVFRWLAGAGRGARPGRRRRPGALRRVANGGGSPGGGSRRAPARPRRIFRRAGHRV